MVKNSKIIVVLIVCVTIVALAAIGAYVFVNMHEQESLRESNSQILQDKLYYECLERTREEAHYGGEGVDKEGCKKDPIGR